MLNSRARSATNRLLIAVAIVTASCYLVHLDGPLRMVGDAPLYLAGANDIASGWAYHEVRMPRGYPQALAALKFIGLNSNAGIVGLNLVCMAVGLVLICSVIQSEIGLSQRSCITCALLCCLSWTWINAAQAPMSEMPFFLLSSAALAALSVAKGRSAGRAIALIVSGAVLSLAAFSVRTIGAALFPAVALGLLGIISGFGIAQRRRAIASFIVGGIILLSLVTLYRDSLLTRGYLGQWHDPAVGEMTISKWRIGEIGELFQNISAGAVSPRGDVLPMSISVGEVMTEEISEVRYLSGFAAIVLIVLGIARRGKLSHVDVFVGCYATILIVWPFTDVRFWAPIFPLLLAIAWSGLRSLMPNSQTRNRVVLGYCTSFCLLGSIAMANSLANHRHMAFVSHAVGAQRPDWHVGYQNFGGVSHAAP